MSTVKFGSFFTSLLKKAGVAFDATDAKYADLLSVDAQIPNDLVKQINEKLMTADAAIENDEVTKRIRASALGSIDKDILKLVEKHELTDLQESLKAEESTRRKLTMVLEAIEGKLSKQGKASASEQDKEIEKLNGLLKELSKTHEKELGDKDSAHGNQLNDLMLEIMLSDYNYAELPGGKAFAIKYAKEQLLNDVAGKKGKLVQDGRNLKLVKAETGGDLFDEQNNKLDLKSLMDGILANHKLLQTNDPNPPNKGTIEIPGAGEGGKANEKAIASIDETLSQFTTQQ